MTESEKDEGMPNVRTPEAKTRNVEAARNAFALKMAALHDLSLELSLAADVGDLCRRAVNLGRGILGFDRIGIWFVSPDDPAILYGSFGVDEKGDIRDERDACYRRSEDALPQNFYEGREPIYYIGVGPCFNHLHEVVGSGEKALALIWDGHGVIGEISVDNLLSQRTIDGGSLELLVRYARIVGSLTSLKRAQDELKMLSEPDSLTGIASRHTTLLVLEKQLRLAARKKGRLAVIYCRLYGLKAANGRLGREAGDGQLVAASAILASTVRDCDTVGRLDGDSFLVVLPDCDADDAVLIDSRLGAALAGANAPLSMARGIAHSGELGDIGPKWSAQALVDLAGARVEKPKP